MQTIEISETKQIRIYEQQGTFQAFYGQVYSDGEFQILKTSPYYKTRKGLERWINKLR